jgi:DNA-binding transcriptional LysR family regulator
VLGTPPYFAAAGEPATPADLSGHRAVIYDRGGGGDSWTFRKDSAELNVTLSDGVRVTAAEGVREAVFAGLGLAVGTEWMFQPELESGRVKEVVGDWTLPPIYLWAVFPTGRRASPKARAFVDFVEAVLAESKMTSA